MTKQTTIKTEKWETYLTNQRFVPKNIPEFKIINEKYNKITKKFSEIGYKLHDPHQTFGVWWCLYKEFFNSSKGYILADEMGLGKTIQILATIYGNEKSTLILVPASLLSQWTEYIKEIFGSEEMRQIGWQYLVHRGKNKLDSNYKINNKTIILASNNAIIPSKKNKKTIFNDYNWERIIIDEGHFFRNKRTKKTINLLKLNYNSIGILTGTPIQNSINDILTLFTIIDIKTNKNNNVFRNKHKIDELINEHLLRRTKKNITKYNNKFKLPPIHIQITILPFKFKKERIFYQEIVQDIYKEWKELKRLAVANGIPLSELMMSAQAKLTRLRQCLAHPQLVIDGHFKKKLNRTIKVFNTKTTKINYLVKQILKTNDKVIIFGQYHKELDRIKNALLLNKKHAITIDSRTKNKDNILKQFSKPFYQNKSTILMKTLAKNNYFFNTQRKNIINNIVSYIPDIDVAVIQIKSGGTGLNLQYFNRIYISSGDWNLANEMQAFARSHRFGQTKKVYIEKLVIKNTIDEQIFQCQRRKYRIMQKCLKESVSQMFHTLNSEGNKMKNSSLNFDQIASILNSLVATHNG